MFHLKNLLFWIAFPFLIPQALYVRSTATRFAPADGPVVGRAGDGEQVQLLAIGDSIVAGVGASTLSAALVGQTSMALAAALRLQVRWQAIGESGYDSSRVMSELLPKLPDHRFNFIIVSVGVNDITGLTSLRRWRRNLSDLLKALESHSPKAVIALAGMPPMHHFPLLPQPLRAVFGLRARLFDQIAKEATNSVMNRVHLSLDFDPDPAKFSPDGYHPSEESYVEFGQQMADRLIIASGETAGE